MPKALGMAVVVLSVGVVSTQQRPSFEAVSVKPNRDATGFTVSMQNGRVRFVGVTARQLLVRAFGVEPFQIIGAPDWVASDRFDVVAVGPADATPAQLNLMLRGVLADRFRLTSRVEERDLPVFFLTLARDDGRLGPDVRPTAVEDCGKPQTPSRPTSEQANCRLMVGTSSIEATGQTFATLAAMLGPIVGRPVIDRTFEPGRHDFRLSFTPERGRGAPSPSGPQPPDTSPGAPSIYTALEDQLGLKLERQRDPVDVVVIERIEQPAPD